MSGLNTLAHPAVVKVISTNKKHVKKFGLLGMETTFKFTTPPDGVNYIDWVHLGLSHIVENMKRECSDTDHLGFTLGSQKFKYRDPGYVAFRPASEVNDDILWDKFGGIIQSNAESIKSTDNIIVECTRVNTNPEQININAKSGFGIKGALNPKPREEQSRFNTFTGLNNKGRHPLKNTTDGAYSFKDSHVGRDDTKHSSDLGEVVNLLYPENRQFVEECKSKRGILSILNDKLNLPRALIVGRAHVKKDPLYKLIRMNRGERQTLKAKQIMEKAQVMLPTNGYGISELKQFQEYLKNYNITVYNYNRKGRDILF